MDVLGADIVATGEHLSVQIIQLFLIFFPLENVPDSLSDVLRKGTSTSMRRRRKTGTSIGFGKNDKIAGFRVV